MKSKPPFEQISSTSTKVPDPLGIFDYKIVGMNVFVDNRPPIKRKPLTNGR